MNSNLLAKLSEITDEEKEIQSSGEIDTKNYFFKDKEEIEKSKFLEEGKQITFRPHTRFIDFPRHKHNYVEVVYVCKGSITHIVDGKEVLQNENDLMFINQHTYHAIKKASKDDIAVNFIILPQFFDKALDMIDKDNILADFIISTIRNKESSTHYLHFSLGDILEIQNIIENLIVSLMSGGDNTNINDTLMVLLFLYITKYVDNIKNLDNDGYEDKIVKKTIEYIEHNYQTASLSALADRFSLSISTLSRTIKKHTKNTFTELLQEKRFERAVKLLGDTDLSISDIILDVGYENSSYFFRCFKKKYNMSPKKYREMLTAKG